MSIRLRLFARAAKPREPRPRRWTRRRWEKCSTGRAANYGAEFAAVLDGSRVWVNGDEPEAGVATELADGDEVAVLPPVSGG